VSGRFHGGAPRLLYATWWPGLTRAAVIVAGDNGNEAIGTVTPAP